MRGINISTRIRLVGRGVSLVLWMSPIMSGSQKGILQTERLYRNPPPSWMERERFSWDEYSPGGFFCMTTSARHRYRWWGRHLLKHNEMTLGHLPHSLDLSLLLLPQLTGIHSWQVRLCGSDESTDRYRN
jgi:hypothetical protein